MTLTLHLNQVIYASIQSSRTEKKVPPARQIIALHNDTLTSSYLTCFTRHVQSSECGSSLTYEITLPFHSVSEAKTDFSYLGSIQYLHHMLYGSVEKYYYTSNDLEMNYIQHQTMSQLCVVLTTRRYAQARYLLSAGVRLSVRLSRSCIIAKQLKISSNFFLSPVAAAS